MVKNCFKIIGLILMVLSLTACSSVFGEEKKEITIGSKNFTEQYLLSKMTVFLLEENGFDVNEMSNMGGGVLRKALLNNQIDMVWEYTGSALVTYLGKEPISEPKKAFKQLRKLDEKRDIHWMNMSDVNNTYALAMKEDRTRELGIKTLSDLADYVNKNKDEVKVAINAEFGHRPDGLKGVEKTYDFHFNIENVKPMKIGLTYRAIDKGNVDVAMAFNTDSGIKKYGLKILKDDKKFFPSYSAAIAINEAIYEKYPEIEKITKPLAKKLDSEIMRELNYKVDVEGKSVSVVAHNWLVENGLIED